MSKSEKSSDNPPEEISKKNILKLLPSQTNNKMKGAKPNRQITITPKNSSSKTQDLTGDINMKTGMLANGGVDSTTKQNLIVESTKEEVTGKLKRGRGRPRKSKTSDADRNVKRMMKQEAAAAKRRERENKRIEKQMEKERERQKKIMIEARRKAILADKMKQQTINESNKDPMTIQMGSFKLAGSKNPARTNPIVKNNNSTQMGQSIDVVPIDNHGSYRFEFGGPKNSLTRRIEAYAKRELDPSIIPLFNQAIASRLLTRTLAGA